MSYATRSVTVQQKPAAPLRYLPNGMAMKEVEPHEDDGKFYTLEKVYGTRLTGDRRYYLVKFHGYDVLYWLAASCCTGILASLRVFKKAMGWAQMSKEKDEEFILPECLKKAAEDAPIAAPVANTAPATKPTRKRRSASAPRPAKRRSLSPSGTDGPSPPGIAGPAPSTVEKACDGPKGAPACQVTFKGQLLPRFDMAPYAEAYKRGVLPGARRDIVVDLEEVFAGCTKRMIINGDGFTHIVNVRVNPGTLDGQKWTYPLPDGNTITFSLKDASHPRFRRNGSDLVYTHRIPLRDALLGARIHVELFTGEAVTLDFDGAIFQGVTKRIAGYGMPLPEKPWKRGDLVVEFDVEFPDTVLEEYHEALKELL